MGYDDSKTSRSIARGGNLEPAAGQGVGKVKGIGRTRWAEAWANPSHSKEHGEHKLRGGKGVGGTGDPPPQGLRKGIQGEGDIVRCAFQWLPLALMG